MQNSYKINPDFITLIFLKGETEKTGKSRKMQDTMQVTERHSKLHYSARFTVIFTPACAVLLFPQSSASYLRDIMKIYSTEMKAITISMVKETTLIDGACFRTVGSVILTGVSGF